MNSHYRRKGNVHTLQANSFPSSSSEIIYKGLIHCVTIVFETENKVNLRLLKHQLEPDYAPSHWCSLVLDAG